MANLRCNMASGKTYACQERKRAPPKMPMAPTGDTKTRNRLLTTRMAPALMDRPTAQEREIGLGSAMELFLTRCGLYSVRPTDCHRQARFPSNLSARAVDLSHACQ